MTEPSHHSLYEVARDFQPSFAALVAFLAACIAYASATARIRFDRKIRRADQAAMKLGLLLRLRSSVNGLIHEMNQIGEAAYRPGDALTRQEMKNFVRLDAAECDQAWSKLELLPSAAYAPLDVLRSAISMVHRDLERTDHVTGFAENWNDSPVVSQAIKSAVTLVDCLDEAIKKEQESLF